jgi:hypothetical protein
MKECTKCKVVKPLIDFHKSKSSKSGYMSACKACESIRGRAKYNPGLNKKRYEENKDQLLKAQKEYYHKNVGKIKIRSKEYYNKNSDKWLQAGWKKKGILNRDGLYFSKFDQETELQRAGYKCEICKSDGSDHKKGLCVDHNHDTGIVRGILCAHCNSAIGHFHDDINKLEMAITYLNKS